MWKPNRTPVRTQDAPLPPSFLSQAIVAGSQVYCSGQVGVSPSTGKMVEGPIQERTKQILRNLSAVLTAGGSSLQDVVKVNIFLADMGDFAAVNEVYETFFQDPKPVSAGFCFFRYVLSWGVDWVRVLTDLEARTCVAVKTLPLGTDVEIECTGLVTKRTPGGSRL